MDDDAGVRVFNGFSGRRLKKRPRARQVGAEFWRRHADLNCCYSDPDAFHYGQPRQPHIAYLCTESKNEKIRGDLRILELLSEKDEQAQKNIGDPSAFLGVYDEHQEEGDHRPIIDRLD